VTATLNSVYQTLRIYTADKGRQVHISIQELQAAKRHPHGLHDLLRILGLELKSVGNIEDKVSPCLEPELVIRLETLQVDPRLLLQLAKARVQRRLRRSAVTLRKGPLATLSPTDHHRLSRTVYQDRTVDVRANTVRTRNITLKRSREYHLCSVALVACVGAKPATQIYRNEYPCLTQYRYRNLDSISTLWWYR